jgi:putative transposase
MERVEKNQANRRYTPKEKQTALELADKVGPAEASKKLGIPDNTIYGWQFKARKAAEASDRAAASEPTTPAPIEAAEVSAPRATAAKEKKVAKFYSPSFKAQVLEYAAQHGITEAASKFGATRFSIYAWQRKVSLHAEGKAKDSPVVGSDENPAVSRDQRILAEWKSSTGLGPSQVRNQLRRQGMKVSIHTVRCVLEEYGYVTPKVRRKEVNEQRFEAVRPNQMWHLDFLHRYINKQKVYILILLDDFSRFIVGGALWDGERVEAVMETFESSVTRYGRPEKVLSDGGSAFYSWRGVGRFTNLLTELEVDQIVADKPQTNGKLEVLNGNIQKEVFDGQRFFDLAETHRRFRSWIEFYNLRRTHHALGGLLVPADRYFGRAEEVLACIESERPPAGIGEPAPVGERHLDLFRVSSHRGQVELHLMGHRLVLPVTR